jgi:phage shock protein E
MNNLEKLIKEKKATIVDVRTPAEFMGGHVPGSINIPLQELTGRLDEIRKMENLVLCCASGGRSAHATDFLRQQDISCENAGSWLSINSLI